MYIRIFEGKKSSRSYLLEQKIVITVINDPILENEAHEIVTFTENELFHILDKLFKDKQNGNA